MRTTATKAGKPTTEGSGMERVAAVKNLGGTCELLNTVKIVSTLMFFVIIF